MTTSQPHSQRPLSPHLQIYRPQITSVLSILHRITGVLLSLGALVLAVWLFAAAFDGALYEMMQECFLSDAGTVALVGWSAAFYYHLCNGIRHLCWDAGKGFALDAVTRSGMLVLLGAGVMTAATWLHIWGML